tara:strand:- start:1690 stop:1887 length:198 start_codon:yes stop_codon:yes gene_type:complete
MFYELFHGEIGPRIIHLDIEERLEVVNVYTIGVPLFVDPIHANHEVIVLKRRYLEVYTAEAMNWI